MLYKKILVLFLLLTSPSHAMKHNLKNTTPEKIKEKIQQLITQNKFKQLKPLCAIYLGLLLQKGTYMLGEKIIVSVIYESKKAELILAGYGIEAKRIKKISIPHVSTVSMHLEYLTD